ncbi:hypothetical protein, partial [Pseudomonas syringae group genomosp. 7]|uniref:hypothetical protein n=1 Tax=Pseudomonas syringae group genomosp. 7 TaxID=251699 RepID=UPI003770308F
TREIAAALLAVTSNERVVDIALGSERGQAHITPRNADAANVQLTGHTRRAWLLHIADPE